MEKNYYPGYWNGEAKAKFRVVVVEVGDEPEESKEHFKKFYPNQKKYLWFAPFIGETRQVVEVVYADETFYLDNADGTGIYKVTKGLGSPHCGHSSLYPAKILHEVPKKYWQETSETVRELVHDEINERWMAIDPTGYTGHRKRMDLMRSHANKIRERIAKGQGPMEFKKNN